MAKTERFWLQGLGLGPVPDLWSHHGAAYDRNFAAGIQRDRMPNLPGQRQPYCCRPYPMPRVPTDSELNILCGFPSIVLRARTRLPARQLLPVPHPLTHSHHNGTHATDHVCRASRKTNIPESSNRLRSQLIGHYYRPGNTPTRLSVARQSTKSLLGQPAYRPRGP